VTSFVGLIAILIIISWSMTETSSNFQEARAKNSDVPEPLANTESPPTPQATSPQSDTLKDYSLVPETPAPAVAEPTPARSTETLSTFEDVVTLTEKSVCLIQGKASSGSGFLIDTDKVMTNRHVVDSMLVDEIKVLFTSDESIATKALDAKIIYEDPNLDVAILKIQPIKTRPLEIDSETRDSFRRGRDVIAIGSPGVKIVSGTLENAVSRGLLSSQTTIDGIDYYQASISINPGNSGGPILAMDGKVLGMITLRDNTVEGIAFAIPAHSLLDILNTPDQDFRTLTGEQLARLNTEHDARTIVNRVTLLLVANSIRLENIVENIRAGIEKQNFTVDQAFDFAIELDAGNREQRRDTLESITAPIIPKISSSKLLGENVRAKIAELWSVYKEIRSYADSPRGSANSMRQKSLELGDKWIRLRNELGALLNINIR
jgi:S1-C subfamily serine protease